jgi:hypothetical protein
VKSDVYKDSNLKGPGYDELVFVMTFVKRLNFEQTYRVWTVSCCTTRCYANFFDRVRGP